MKQWTFGALCFLGGLTIGPPLLGAVTSVFWQENYESSTKWEVASDLSGSTARSIAHGYFEQPIVEHGSCAEPYLTAPARIGVFGEPYDDLTSAVEYNTRLVYASSFERSYANYMMSLPAPVLGALEYCIGGSLLTSFCGSYVQMLLENSTLSEKTKAKELFRSVKEREERLYCAASDPEAAQARHHHSL